MHSDPIADMITRIRNGYRARLGRVAVRASRINESIATILQREGYIRGFARKDSDGDPQGTLDVELKYDAQREAVLGNIKRVSKPGLRRYFSCADIPVVRNGLGIVILTTSRGVMTGREATKAGLGGEVLCTVY